MFFGTQKKKKKKILIFILVSPCTSCQLLLTQSLIHFCTKSQDSVNDIAGALESILEFKNESVLRIASDLAVKMVRVFPSSLLESHATYLVDSLVFLLGTQQLQVSISCATALNSILSNLSTKRERNLGDSERKRLCCYYSEECEGFLRW